MKLHEIAFHRFHAVIVGSGAAGLNAALRLYEMGQKDIAIVTEGLHMGTSRNTGSDKQTYYKMSLGGCECDSVHDMARTLFGGGCVDGDIAMAEAAGSVRSFFHLVELGVPFPTNASGEYIGYKTDHDPMNRGTSAGPYTSKFMTEALERRVMELGVPVFDKQLVVRLLTSDEKEGKRARGIIAINQLELQNPEKRFTLFAADNIIWATGGEAGMYQASVYPYGQNGGSGVLFAAGAVGKNLTESQFGIASTKFRWNLSGSFQQCIPRYVSVDDDGKDEREFLQEAFDFSENYINAVFLKGYQWPFDPRKTMQEGSSYVDLLIYQEEVIRGRHVYMDFMHNPSVLEKDGRAEFSCLSKEAREYLKNCDALQDTPYERLKQINPAAIKLYLDHGIDLSKEKLAVSICAQHNNGGVAGNAWWESEIKHLFPVGEVNGSHGVYRPGGTALNAGQVGGMRAAQYITHHYNEEPQTQDELLQQHEEEIRALLQFAQEAAAGREENAVQVKAEIRELRERMTRYGSCIRSEEGVKKALEENLEQRLRLRKNHGIVNICQMPDLFRLMELNVAQYVYLKAIENYIEEIGVSRNSYLVYNKKGKLPHDGIDERFRNITEPTNMKRLQEIRYDEKTGKCMVWWRSVRPLQESDQWFETAWKKYRNGEAFNE